MVVSPSLALAQESKSATLATELAKLLDSRKLDSIAARGAAPDEYVGCLYFPGSQLLVVGAKYAAPERMKQLLEAKNYRDVYIDLNSASVPQTKVFVSDLGVNGLRFEREGSQPWDTVDIGGKSYSFDGDWGKAKISGTSTRRPTRPPTTSTPRCSRRSSPSSRSPRSRRLASTCEAEKGSSPELPFLFVSGDTRNMESEALFTPTGHRDTETQRFSGVT